MMFFSPTYLFMVAVPSFLVAYWAQTKVKNAIKEYSRVANQANLTGAQAARKILDRYGLVNIKITVAKGWLGDHYDPVNRELRLSPEIYSGKSIAGAKQTLINCNIITPNETAGVKSVLNAAALTYVAAALGSILQLLYFIGLARRN